MNIAMRLCREGVWCLWLVMDHHKALARYLQERCFLHNC